MTTRVAGGNCCCGNDFAARREANRTKAADYASQQYRASHRCASRVTTARSRGDRHE
jgi:hypothetical protein